MKISLFILLCFLLVLSSCQESPKKAAKRAKTELTQANVEEAQMEIMRNVYLPIYSDIYDGNISRKILLTGTVSIRNINPADSIYVFHVDYYDSKGILLHSYIESPVLLKELESIEFIVDESEKSGGAGANFLIEWGSITQVNTPIIHAVMISSANQQGISFITEGVELDTIQ